MNKPVYFAEVIESCLSHYTAQCWQWDNFPSFGSLVHVQEKDITILGIVTNVQTGSIDPTRSPFPYQKTEAELKAEQPQIFEFLKTTFTVNVVGHCSTKNNDIWYILPATPCKIHAFVAQNDDQTMARFFGQPDFLHLLFGYGASIPNLDELLLAIIKQLASKNLLSQNAIDNFCQSFTLLTGNDYRRLKLFLKRVENLI